MISTCYNLRLSALISSSGIQADQRSELNKLRSTAVYFIGALPVLFLWLALTIASEAEVNFDNAVGIWLLDEGVGQVAKDSSANGNDGELIKKPKCVIYHK